MHNDLLFQLIETVSLGGNPSEIADSLLEGKQEKRIETLQKVLKQLQLTHNVASKTDSDYINSDDFRGRIVDTLKKRESLEKLFDKINKRKKNA